MIGPFDIFFAEKPGPTWRGHAETLEAAKAQVRASRAGAYMIVSLKTKHRMLVQVDEQGILVELTPEKG